MSFIVTEVMLDSFLDVSREPEKSDCIFVFAGREERKRFGLELYRQGFAPRLILSVGRFEWRRFVDLGLPDDGGLVDMVQRVEPTRRHFFVIVEPERVECLRVPPGRFGTLSEARALASVLEGSEDSKILVVSSGEHLRRCILSLRSVLSTRYQLAPVSSGRGRDPATSELFKLAGYTILSVLARLGFS